MTQARPKTFKVMSFHGALGKEKPLQEEWRLSGFHPGVAGGPECSEKDCAYDWDHPRHSAGLMVGEGPGHTMRM